MLSFIRSFRRSQSGNILMLTGLSFLFLIGIGGAAYDLGKQQLVKQKIQQATDAAALAAAGREPGTTDADRRDTANTFFQLNYPTTYLGIARPTPNITITPNANVEVSATNVNVPTSFVQVFNVNTLPANGRTVAQIKANDVAKVDVILVMDNTGSMGEIGASEDVGAVNIIEGTAATRTACRNGWFAYGYPRSPAQLGRPYPNTCNNDVSCCNYWGGITGANRINALRYSATQFTNDLMDPNPLDHRIGVITWDVAVMNAQGLVNNAATVRTFLGLMYGRGATDSSQGLRHAINYIPAFRADAVPVIVLMTDGANNNPSQAASNNASILACNTLKAHPRTLIFSIAFGSVVNNNAVSRQFLSDCATGPNGTANPKPNENIYFFAAPDAASLDAAFAAIVGVIKKVRVLQ